MAAPFPCTFSKSIEKFKARLSDEQKASFSVTSLQDVERSIQDIQDRLGPEKRLRRFGRIRKFLEGMKQIEELVKIFLNVHEVVAFVWGPIKLALMIAATRIDTIELLLGVYEDIGEVIHGLKKYDRLFRNHEDVRHVLGIYFHDVLEFHYCVLDVFARPAWKRFFDCAWPTFRTRFKPIIESLKRHRDLLADEKVTAVIEEVQSSSSKLDELSKNVKQGLEKLKDEIGKEIHDLHNSSLKQKSALVARFEPPDYEADQQSIWSHRTSTQSGDWVFSDPKFKKWTQSSIPSDNILYLSGGPGSGKTTLVSRIIDRMRVHGTSFKEPVVFFYFRHRDASKASMAAMLRALIVQILNQDDTTLECLCQKCGSMSNTEILNPSTLKELMTACMAMQRRLWVILDGLDEAENQHNGSQEASKILGWFKDAMGSGLQAHQVRLLIAGQRDGHVDQVLSSYPEIKLEAVTSHDEDIKEYSKTRAAAIKERFSLEDSEEMKIIKMVTDTSKGMFLYAKVVLDNLFAQDSLCEFEDEMASDNFPADLEKAYDRTVIRVLEKPPPARRKSAVTILGWVLCSARPLRWREIQSRFCINANTGICNFKNRRIDSCKVLCGSFIEEDPCERYEDVLSELSIRLVHETAGKYLVHTGRINLLEEHARTALFCCRYLTSGPFASSLERSDVEKTAMSGYYSFNDYAVAYSYHHAEFLITKTDLLERQLQSEVRDNVSNMLEYYQPQEVSANNQINGSHEQESHELELLLDQWRAAQAEISTILENRISTIRQIQESLKPPTPLDAKKILLLELEGPIVFKCPKISCHKFANGFRKQDDRDNHIKEHERPFKCHEQDCCARIIGFPSLLDLKAHRLRFHSEEILPAPLFTAPQIKGASKLYSACSSGNLDAVKILIITAHNFKAEQLSYAMGHAAYKGHTSICKYFIESGVDVQLVNNKCSPITQAIRRRDWALVLWLWHTAGLKIEDITVPSEHYYLCIGQAIQSEAREIFDYLVKDKSQPEIRNAVGYVLRMLSDSNIVFEKPAQPTKEITTLLHSFFKLAYPEIYGADKMVASTLHCPCEDENYTQDSSNWHFQLIQIRKTSGWTPFYSSILFRNYALVNFFLDLLCANDLQIKSPRGHTALHLLLFRGIDVQIISDIASRIVQIDRGASANSKDNDGNIPLSIACRWPDCASVLDILIDSTVDLDWRNREVKSPLDVAVTCNNLEATTALLATKRVNLSSKIKSGRTIFSLAAETNCVEKKMLKLLYDADPSLAVCADSSVDRLTPLHYASRNHPIMGNQSGKTVFLLSLSEVDLLVEEYCKADWPDRLRDLERLCQFAEFHGLSDALAVLRRHQAKLNQGEKIIKEHFRPWEDD